MSQFAVTIIHSRGQRSRQNKLHSASTKKPPMITTQHLHSGVQKGQIRKQLTVETAATMTPVRLCVPPRTPKEKETRMYIYWDRGYVQPHEIAPFKRGYMCRSGYLQISNSYTSLVSLAVRSESETPTLTEWLIGIACRSGRLVNDLWASSFRNRRRAFPDLLPAVGSSVLE